LEEMIGVIGVIVGGILGHELRKEKEVSLWRLISRKEAPLKP